MGSESSIAVSSWLRTGRLAGLGRGDSRRDVVARLGRPDDWLANARESTSACWRYGAVEFGFDDNEIRFIQVDTHNLCRVELHDDTPDIDWETLHHEMALDRCLDWLVARRFDLDLRFEVHSTSIYLANAFLTFDDGLVNIASPTAPPGVRDGRRL
jgi:hypothetical protein